MTFLSRAGKRPASANRVPDWRWLFAIVLSLLILALAGPSWQQREQLLLAPATARVLIIDLSASMQAADISPSRIEWARNHLLNIVADDFDGETALIAFSGQTYVVSPLTRDQHPGTISLTLCTLSRCRAMAIDSTRLIDLAVELLTPHHEGKFLSSPTASRQSRQRGSPPPTPPWQTWS